MRRTDREGGFALLLLIGITATLAILATTAVLVLGNQQHATAADRSQTQSFDYAEAGLNSAVMAVRTQTWPAANAAFLSSDLAKAYDLTYPSGSAPPLTVKVYDNQNPVNPAITWDRGGPTAPTTPDGKLWVETQVTVNGKTSRMRTLVGQVNLTTPMTLPHAAFYTDGNINTSTGDVYAFKADGTPDTSKQIALIAGGKFTGGWGTDLWPNGVANPTNAQTLDIRTNGQVVDAQLGWNRPGTGGVAPLSSVFPQSTVDTLTSQAKAGSPTQANDSGTAATPALLTQLQANQSSQTTNVGYDLVVNGDLNLRAGTANFRSLYVNGNLTVSSGGAMHATSLYVKNNFTVSGTDKTETCGPTYVGGNVSLSANCTVATTDYTDASKAPAPLYVGGTFDSSGGPFYHNFGPTYVAGNCTFNGNQGQILCPLWVTSGQITTSGSCVVGTLAEPVLLMALNHGTPTPINLNGNGMITGLIVNEGGGVNIGNSGTPYMVRGAVFSTGDVNFTNGGAQAAYDPNGLNFPVLTASSTTTDVMSGTWQELSPSGN